jgi:hypothetical protein
MITVDPTGIRVEEATRYDSESAGLIESSVLDSVNPRDSLLYPTVAWPR